MTEEKLVPVWIPEFKCPYCGSEKGILEMEECPVSWSVEGFEIACWSGEAEELVDYNKTLNEWEETTEWEAEAVDIDYGDREVNEPDISEVYYCCASCLTHLDSDLLYPADLFRWLKERNMLRLEVRTGHEVEF
jgi:hypothetical protein